MTLNDPRVVQEEYASERGLEGRRAAYRYATGPDAPQMAFEAVAEVSPQRVLEVGCGPGELAARIGDELGAEVVAVDSSPPAQAGLARVLTFDDPRVVDPAHAGWMIGRPGNPRAGVWPPRNAFTVAPTSANSPS